MNGLGGFVMLTMGGIVDCISVVAVVDVVGNLAVCGVIS